MTAKEAVDITFAASRQKRPSRFDRICRLRGFCQTEPLWEGCRSMDVVPGLPDTLR